MTTPHDSRPYDLTLLGATGFTGRQTAALLAKQASERGYRLLLAARNGPRLEALGQDLPGSPDLRVVDALSPADAASLAEQTRVLVTTVGPYALYGSEVLAACAEAGTHYADITGEVHWVRDMIERWHPRAVETGAKILPFCGFDSVPSDLGVWMLREEAERRWGEGLEQTEALFSIWGGGLNGGTLASALAMQSSGARRVLADPFSLTPRELRPEDRTAHYDLMRPGLRPLLERRGAPFFMAPVNTRVVRRSAALLQGLQADYGPSFRYQEALGVRSWWQGWAWTWGLGLGFGLLKTRLGRALARRLGPRPGEGPSERQMDRGGFRLRLAARTPSGESLRGEVVSQGDAGNRSTVRMLAACAMALADGESGPHPGGGVLTPASALGSGLLTRLRQEGMRWEITEEPRAT